jgi:hypothetical protein
MLFRIVIIYFILHFTVLGQGERRNEVDSLRLQQKYQILLGNNNGIKIPLYSVGEILDPYDSPFSINFLTHSQGNISELNSFAMQRIRSNISQSFAIYRQGQNKYHLGVISDVLGYVSTAAAAGLAAYHVYKYKKKYGIK